jgi:hypothetical protein
VPVTLAKAAIYGRAHTSGPHGSAKQNTVNHTTKGERWLDEWHAGGSQESDQR